MKKAFRFNIKFGGKLLELVKIQVIFKVIKEKKFLVFKLRKNKMFVFTHTDLTRYTLVLCVV